MSLFLRFTLLSFGIFWLAGCSVFRPAPPVYTNPELPKQWEAEGKAALRTANRGVHVYFTWQQNGDDYRIIVRGPLGLGRAELYGNPRQVRLQADNIKGEVSASSLEELLEMATNRRAPVSNILHWIKAEAATPEAKASRDLNGKLTRLKEGDWVIHYLEWSSEAPNLPRRLTIEGPDGKATVVIGLWRIKIDEATEPVIDSESAPPQDAPDAQTAP